MLRPAILPKLPKLFWGGIFVLMTAPGSSFAKDLPPEWKYFQTLQVGETGLVKMTLPAESYSASRAQGEDLRLLDESGKEIPYVLDFPSPVKMERRQVRDLKTSLESDATKVSIQTGVGETITALILETPSSDFFKSVSVEGSVDGASWTTLRDGAPIFQQN
ncbi:MAG: hypothetical protein JNM63_05605, partial [Spirochaetia bacterium]|nr:hypothetical protein [Spirochaetia bacterium]